VSLTPKVFANFIRDCLEFSEMSSWAFLIIAGVFIDFSFEISFALSRWVGRTFFGYLRSQIFSRNIIYGWSRILEEPNNFGLQTLSAKAFDYCRSSVIFRTLLRHFEVLHAYYKHVICPNVNNDLSSKSNEAGNSNLNLSGFWWQTLYYRESRLPTLRLTTATHSNRWLKAFHRSSAVNDWWSIATWTNGRHSYYQAHNSD